MTQGSSPAACRMPTAPSSRVTSHMFADIIIGCTSSTGGPACGWPGPAVRREIPPELVHRHALDDLRRRRGVAGFQPTESQDLQAVLRCRDQTLNRSGDR